jgi:hypothetical protein
MQAGALGRDEWAPRALLAVFETPWVLPIFRLASSSISLSCFFSLSLSLLSETSAQSGRAMKTDAVRGARVRDKGNRSEHRRGGARGRGPFLEKRIADEEKWRAERGELNKL